MSATLPSDKSRYRLGYLSFWRSLLLSWRLTFQLEVQSYFLYCCTKQRLKRGLAYYQVIPRQGQDLRITLDLLLVIMHGTDLDTLTTMYWYHCFKQMGRRPNPNLHVYRALVASQNGSWAHSIFDSDTPSIWSTSLLVPPQH